MTIEAQDIFDRVVVHLFQQGRKSIQLGDQCKYRTTNEHGQTLKCAVGCLIDDRVYRQALEDKLVGNTLVLIALADSLKAPYSQVVGVTWLLEDLQAVHDDAAEDGGTPPRWKNGGLELYYDLRRVAERHALNTAALDRAYNEYQEARAGAAS